MSQKNELIALIDDNAEFFAKSKRHKDVSAKLAALKIAVNKASMPIEEINLFAAEYDFDQNSPGNGYRSFGNIYDAAVIGAIKICNRLIRRREKILFSADNCAK